MTQETGEEGLRVSEESIQKHSKSFALASRVLPPDVRGHAVALYAWCRRADDAVDLVEPVAQPDALRMLRSELSWVYRTPDDPDHESSRDPILTTFQRTVRAREIPRRYAEDLLRGMEMDVEGRRYDSLEQLFEYCYYVAGCVGLMMCHAMGVRDDRALANAVHLGMAMQITNICRDVEEDWRRDRLYLPNDLLTECGYGGLADSLGESFPEGARVPIARTIERLLVEADRFYRSGDTGLPALSWRCSMAIRTARQVYSAIGERLRARGCDPLAGRAYVSTQRKLALMVGSVAAGGVAAAAGSVRAKLLETGNRRIRTPSRVLDFPNDVLPVSDHGLKPKAHA